MGTTRAGSGNRGDVAASEIVGNILLLAIAVALATVFALALLNIPAPAATATASVHAFVPPASTDQVVLEHRGGPAIPLRELAATITVNGAATRFVVGDSLGSGWTVTAPSGATRTATQSFSAGDQAVYTSATLPGKAVTVTLADTKGNVLLLGAASVARADTTAPGLVSARTRTTTTIDVTFTEPLKSIVATDFTVTGSTVASVVLLGNGTTAEITTTLPFVTSATPTVSTIAVPTGTRDRANLLVTGGQSVVATDGVAPAITVGPLVGTITSTSATVTWTTGESSTSVVAFGPTTALGRTQSDATPVLAHSIPLSSLTPSTLYSYTVSSADAAGNTVTSAQGTFTTAAAAGGGGGTASDYLAFLAAPGSIDPGIPSNTFFVGLRDSAGAPKTATSTLTVTLGTNSTLGRFTTTGGSPATTVTIPAGQSQATFVYIDRRTTGDSVITASTPGVIAATTTVTVTPRGIASLAGNATSALRVHVLHAAAHRPSNVTELGYAILNPTPNAMTIDLLRVNAVPTGGIAASTVFFAGTLGHGAGTDGDFTGCTWAQAGTNPNVATCNPAGTFTIPAYAMRQGVLTFTTSAVTSDGGWSVTAEVVTTAPSASTVPSSPHYVHLRSSGEMLSFLPRASTATTNLAGGVSLGAGGTPKDIVFRFAQYDRADTGVNSASGYVSVECEIPAGWRDLSFANQPGSSVLAPAVTQPTATAPGTFTFSRNLNADVLAFTATLTATPPAVTGLYEIPCDVNYTQTGREPTGHRWTPVVGVKVG